MIGTSASAQELREKLPQVSSEPEADTSQLEHVEVTDEVEDFVTNAASPHKISKEKVDLYKYTDVNRVLRQTTGAYVREEDGQGLRPNIGLRGTNPDRSKKVVILEDGILAGPAPYAAPAAYYTPSMNHAQSLEVFKGFTAVPYGPNSIGGAVNYLSLDIPSHFSPKAEASAGAFNTQNYRLSVGANLEKLGYVVQASRLSSDGFKVLDGGGFTGFEKNEISVKTRTRLPDILGASQNIETRLGYSDEVSNETYLGLSVGDLAQSPFRRYASSALDEMDWQHTKAEIQHTIQINSSSQLKTTAYRHDFERLWYRLDRFLVNPGQRTLFDVLRDPQAYQNEYAILSGQQDSSSSLAGAGNLVVLGNQRTFYSQGVQTQYNSQFSLGPTDHDLEVGLRYHQDQIRRTHLEHIYQMTAGQLVPTTAPATPDALNRVKASALTLNLLENIKWKSWVLTLLGRMERVRFTYDNDLTAIRTPRDDSIFAPGAGLLYHLDQRLSAKVSVNRGVSVAGLSDAGTEAKEESVNYEAGLKYVSDSQNSQLELVAFYNDYSNITGTCTGSTGCAPNQIDLQFNGGAAVIQGVEARLSQNFQWGAARFPLQLNLTALRAEFDNSFNSTTAEWGNGTVRRGDPLPYIPQVQYTFSAGAEYKKFKNELAFIYQGESYDQSVAANRLEIPAYGVVDWTGRYDINRKTQIFARVDNLLGKEYIVSYKPFGARPGKPQSFMVGMSYTF